MFVGVVSSSSRLNLGWDGSSIRHVEGDATDDEEFRRFVTELLFS